jgi:prepilin-type N-terminal cleavage/methylation domain-containing protein
MRTPVQRAFTLLETIIAVSIAGVVLSGVLGVLYVLFGNQAPTTVRCTTNYGTNDFNVVPSSSALVSALRLMDELQKQISDASATFVLGGFRETAVASPSAGQAAPLSAGYVFPAVVGSNLGEVNVSANSIPLTATDFRSVMNSRNGIAWEGSYNAADFTIVTMTGLVTVSSVTQVRRKTTTSDGRNYACYEVVLDTNLTQARNASEGAAGQNRFSYRMALPATEDSWTVALGALHYWFRWDTTWNRREEGPSLLVFPDPYVTAGDQPSGNTKPFSRFIYFTGPNT